MTRRVRIEPKRIIFVGCEGESERGYVSLLQHHADGEGLRVQLNIDPLGPGTGDPLSRVERAVRRLLHLRKTRIAPGERFALLDEDQALRDPRRAELARKLAAENDITIVWQRPCFEAVLLRHLPGRAAHQPQTSPLAQEALHREWPGYQKPMSRTELARMIDLVGIRRAAMVEPELRLLLRCIGLMADD